MLIPILIVGGYLRFTNLDWDRWKWIHPDESHMQSTLTKISTPEDLLADYFDTRRSSLNIRNHGDQYSYGTLPLFLARFVAEDLDWTCLRAGERLREQLVEQEGSEVPGSPLKEAYDQVCGGGPFTSVRSKLVGRILSGVADMGTILLVFLIGRRLYGDLVGVLAAALTALTAFLIQQAHFFTVDSALCFCVTLAAYCAVRVGETGEWLSFGLAGAAVGMAAACKVSGAYAALLVVLAAVAWIWALPAQQRRWGVWNGLLRLCLAGLLALVAFRVAQPYAFEGPGFFGLRPSADWFDRLGQIQNEQSGNIDAPPDQQWANRPALLFPWLNIVIWGMGLPLGLAAWVGWAVVGVEMWRGKRVPRHLVLWTWTTLMSLYLGTRWVKSMRYFIYLYPLLIILAAYVLVRLCRASFRWVRCVGVGLAVVVLVGTALWGYAVFSIYLREHTRLAAGQWIYDHVPDGSTLAEEHWDWGPHIPGGKSYRGLATSSDGQMQNYHEDTPEKRAQMIAWLDEADYIVISSNRIYASVTRLKGRHAGDPTEDAGSYRYPMTTAYYRALFAGELGFELVADFTAAPAIGPFQFPDQETPFPLTGVAEDIYIYQREPIQVHLPPAEEAFSVYDHPRVLIFRKTEAYSRERVTALLGRVEVERALQHVKPIEFTAAPELMSYDAQTWADQQAGGTWSEMFNQHDLLNRYPVLAAIAWWVVVALMGLLAFPLMFVALPRLRDRGYGLARVLGLLILAYLTWALASLHILPNTRWTILGVFLLLALVGGGVGWRKREALRDFARRNWRLIAVTEGLFALLYAAWIFIRFLQPDLWHPVVGGEKPMDFAYFNAVMKSTWFPPYNPWLSGGYINYYYFGFVIVGTLTKLIGTVPAIAYNLAVPLLCAMTGVGAFSVAYNLVGSPRRAALLAGVAALTFAVALGNLGVVRLIRDALVTLGGGPAFPSTIPGYPETVAMFKGLWELVAHGTPLPLRTESWYWNPTRIIPGETGNPIAEFPAFTFLYADLHAHMIAFPLTLLALALAVYWVRDPRPRWASLVIGGLVVGALRPTNTWDYYTYTILGLSALLLGGWSAWRTALRRRDEPVEGWALWRRIRELVLRVALFAGLASLLYLPYTQHYAGYSEIARWGGGRTPVDIYLWIHGIMLFPLTVWLGIEVWRLFRWQRKAGCKAVPRLPDSVLGWWVVLFGFVILSLCLLWGTLTIWRMTDLKLPITPVYFLEAFEAVPVSLAALPLAAAAALLFFAPETPLNRRLVWALVGLAMAISIGVEIIVVKGDIGRQNTVFKFYLQVWLLLSVAAGVAVAWLRERARRWSVTWQYLWWGGLGLLVVGGALFLPFGVRARATDRMAGQEAELTLDGMAFMEKSSVFAGPEGQEQPISLYSDYHAIRWMQDNIPGSPVVLEGLGWREYLWANRVSIYTGLPTVAGWRWHQVQQRPMLPAKTVDQRREDVGLCYSTANVGVAINVLKRYGVRYIYVGDYEKAVYNPTGLAKFDRMVEQGLLTVVYDAYGARIYEVPHDLLSTPPQAVNP